MADVLVKGKEIPKPSFEQQASGMRQSIRQEIDVWERALGQGLVRIYGTTGQVTEKVPKRPKGKVAAKRK